eukprot:scaffold92217_cov68-Cyclotella_meneghiniana.AAC.5
MNSSMYFINDIEPNQGINIHQCAMSRKSAVRSFHLVITTRAEPFLRREHKREHTMLKSTIAILTTLLAVSSAFTAPPLRATSPTKSTSQPSIIDDISPRARQPDVIVTKNALREFANWNDVWDGYGGGYGGYGGGYGGMRLRR